MPCYRINVPKWSLICLLLSGGTALLRGEKIQFDIPEVREDQPIAVPDRPKPSQNRFGNTPSPGPNSIPNYQPPAPTPRPMERFSKEELEKKRNWLSPEAGENKTAEEIFNVTGFTTRTEEKESTFLGQSLEDGKTTTAGDQLQKKSSFPQERELENRLNGFAPAIEQQRGMWDAAAVFENRLDRMARPNNSSDFWGEKLNEQLNTLSINENAATARRSQISDLLERRNTAGPINSFFDNSRQPVNPVEGIASSPFDRNTQALQKSFTDQLKSEMIPQANLQRNAFEDLKPKIATPLAPKVQTAPPAPAWAKPQPAVLPFPKRPGDIF